MSNTKKTYTNALDAAKVSAEQNRQSDRDVVWEGDSHDVICGFPIAPRFNIGGDLRRVQRGEEPLDWGSVPGLGVPGVLELRDRDAATWYRLIYKVVGNRVFVLHCFTKQSNQIEKRDVRTIQERLTNLNARLREEKRDAKHKAKGSGTHDKGKRSG